MSHYRGLRCVKCGVEAGSLNHGDKIWPRILERVWPALRELTLAQRGSRGTWPIEVEVNVFVTGNDDDTNLWEFLLDHESHGIVMTSQYGDERHPPIVLVEPSERSSGLVVEGRNE